MAREVLEAEAVEELAASEAEEAVDGGPVRPLPAVRNGGELVTPGTEVRIVALAAAGGIVAGAATVAALRVVRSTASRATRSQKKRKSVERPVNVLASRSFLVDIHLLGDK
jgi:hypothetical protein